MATRSICHVVSEGNYGAGHLQAPAEMTMIAHEHRALGVHQLQGTAPTPAAPAGAAGWSHQGCPGHAAAAKTQVQHSAQHTTQTLSIHSCTQQVLGQ